MMWNLVKKYYLLWLEDLMSFLPESFLLALSGKDEKLVYLFRDKQTADIYKCSNNEINQLGTVDINTASLEGVHGITAESLVSIYLPESLFLRQAVSLPKKADKNLREVLSYEINRQTPFNENDVYFDFIVDKNSLRDAAIKSELVVAAKQDIDSVYEAVHQTGVIVEAISIHQGVSDDLCSPPVMNFLAKEKRPVKPKLWVWYNKVAAILLLLLLLISVALPFNMQAKAMQKLQAEIEIFETKASSARKLKDEISIQASELSNVIKRKNQYPAVIQILEELSVLLPDDTWLQRLEYENNKIEIQGESGSASSLIALLEKSELFQQTRFLSQIVQNPRSGAERFHIQSSLMAGK